MWGFLHECKKKRRPQGGGGSVVEKRVSVCADCPALLLFTNNQ
jgi:hypothetical protein